MDELIKKSQELVKNNITGDHDDALIELLADAVLALLLIKPSLTLEVLPERLSKLNIIADKRKVLDMAHDDLGDYMEDDQLKNSNAAVIRQLSIDEEDELSEVRHLLVSLGDVNNYTDIICVLIHELTHLLRFSWSIYDSDSEVLKTKEGIGINIYDGKRQYLRRRNQYLEEGIVQFYANMATKELAGYIDDVDVSEIKTLAAFKKEIPNKKFNSYLLQTSLIEKLSFDMNFLELLEETFEEVESHSKLEKYFNSIMHSSTAFSRFSKLIDNVYLELVSKRYKSEIQENLLELNAMVQEYFYNMRQSRK